MRTIGMTTVIALEDGAGPFFEPRRDAFPDATPDQWRRADLLDPRSVTRDGEWHLHFRCFAIRLADTTVILVDAGIGPAGAPGSSWTPVPGRLPGELAAAAIDPAEVSTVVLTHLHSDHIGWAVVGEPGRPYFPNASYLIQRVEATAIERRSPSVQRQLLAPLQRSDQLRLVDGAVRLDETVRIIATPGHTPGHQSVLEHSGDATLLLTGDLLVHVVQLVEPQLAYKYEDDPAAARASRVKTLREASLLGTPHLGEPFG
jgi:glyoxylase-like metal-dependent hydrolase (beta-lactamase superfamily II)